MPDPQESANLAAPEVRLFWVISCQYELELAFDSEWRTIMGLEGAILVPILILGSAAIIYFGLNHVRERKREEGE